MIKVLVSGAHGRMGQEAVAAIKQDPQLEYVGESVRGDHLAEKIKQYNPDVVLDLTTPDVVYQQVQIIIEQQKHPVIGTTGLTAAQIEHLQQLCKQKKLGGIIAPNFSLGVLLMTKMAALAAAYLPHAEIIEMHHQNKKDSPSGTSIKTAKTIAQHRLDKNIHVPDDKSEARGYICDNVPIHSVRLPGLVAHERIIFGGTYEALEIRHDSFDRKSFMPGVLMACKKVTELNELIYGLEHLL